MGHVPEKKETEVSTIDETIEDSVCQSVEKTVVGEGEVSVGGDIGTSECWIRVLGDVVLMYYKLKNTVSYSLRIDWKCHIDL